MFCTVTLPLILNLVSMSMSTIFETEGDKVEAAHMVAIKSDLNKLRAITWERVKDATQAELHELLQLIHEGLPESKGYLPEKLGEFWEYRKKLFVFDNVVLMQDRVVIPPLRKQVLLALYSAHQGVSGMGLNSFLARDN